MTAITKKKRHSRETVQDRILDIIFYLIVGAFMLCCFYPVYFVILASFSSSTAVNSGAMLLWPVDFHLTGYVFVFSDVRIITGYTNTIMYTACGTVLGLICSLMAGYSLSRKDLPFRNAIMMIMVFTMYFGGGMIPAYLNIRDLGLLDSWWVLIVNGAFSVYNMIITRTYYAGNFPDELAEAARIDGAGEMRIFFQLALPLSTAIISVMVLYHAVGHWNSWFNAMIYINDMDKYPLQLVLRQVLLQNSSISLDQSVMQDAEAMMDMMRRQRLAETMKYSVIFIANAPVLALYPFVQKYFTKGVMVGSVKG